MFAFRARLEKEQRAMAGEPTFDVPSRQKAFNPDQSQPARMQTPAMGTRQVPVQGPIDRGIYEAGGKVTDFLTARGASPEVAAGGGYLANVGMQAIPTFLGGEGAKVAAPVLEKGARSLMASALKPTANQWKSGDAAKAIDTLLEEGINPTTGGVAKLKAKIDDLDAEITQIIANSPATVSKGAVGLRLKQTLDQAKKQVNPADDIEAIKRAWMEFRSHPDLLGKQDIPIQLAQELKQGTYQQLKKKYGEAGTADTEAQKALARGLKEEIATAEPAAAEINKQLSKLLSTLDVTERRALMDMNKNPGGLAWLSSNPVTWAAFMADKSAAFKSILARMLHQGQQAIPANAARAAIGVPASESAAPPQRVMADLLREQN